MVKIFKNLLLPTNQQKTLYMYLVLVYFEVLNIWLAVLLYPLVREKARLLDFFSETRFNNKMNFTNTFTNIHILETDGQLLRLYL